MKLREVMLIVANYALDQSIAARKVQDAELDRSEARVARASADAYNDMSNQIRLGIITADD